MILSKYLFLFCFIYFDLCTMIVQKYLAFKLTILLLIINQINAEHIRLKIAGGVRSKQYNLAQFLLSLRNFTPREKYYFGTSHFCGGVLLTEIHVLTAAHCVYVEDVDTFYVVSGSPRRLDYTENTQSKNVKRIILHSKYNDKTLDNDIAIVIVDSPFRLNKFTALVKLPTKPIPHDCNLVVAGWGRIYQNGPKPNEVLYGFTSQRSYHNCSKTFMRKKQKAFCVGDSQMQAYIGDSGGPLLCKDIVVGVVSYGDSAILGRSVFTNVTHFMPWIKSALSMSDMATVRSFSTSSIKRINLRSFNHKNNHWIYIVLSIFYDLPTINALICLYCGIFIY